MPEIVFLDGVRLKRGAEGCRLKVGGWLLVAHLLNNEAGIGKAPTTSEPDISHVKC